MKREYQKKEILARGKDIYIGMDVHKDSWHVTIRAEGEELLTVSMQSSYHALRKLLDRFNACKIEKGEKGTVLFSWKTYPQMINRTVYFVEREIAVTDEKIDEIVYGLYGITPSAPFML